MGALRSGLIDCIGTDHAPHATHEKEVPFERQRWGRPGWRPHSPLCTPKLVLVGELELATLVERMTGGGALLRLPVPRIALDQMAAVCVVDLEASFQVGARGYVSRSENCCFHGQTFRGRVLLTVAGGTVAFRAPALADSAALAPSSEPGGAAPMTDAAVYVMLEDGARFDGVGCAADGIAVGEIVFTTSMSGYQEAVTDPSYAGQLLVFTYPQIGNYGVRDDAMESDRIHARAAIMRAAVDRDDSPGAQQGWLSWMKAHRVPAITEVDTRALVRHIRSQGAMRGGLFQGR